MNILVIDQEGLALAFILRCLRHDHHVKWFLMPGVANSTIGDGFRGVEKITNWQDHVNWADLIWCTGNDKYVQKLERLRNNDGINYFGPSSSSSSLEIKRKIGMQFLEKHGIIIPKYHIFQSIRDAEIFAWKSSYPYVFKTLGDNEDKSLSYVSKTAADLVARLQYWQRIGMNPKGEVMLQEKIEGIEMGVSRWMGAEGFIGPYNENFEFKKLMSSDCGPNTGESGTVLAYVEDSKLGKEILAPLEESLIEMGHQGDIDVNCIIDAAGQAWPLEFTCRVGWPAFNLQLAAHQGDPVEWMLDGCLGEDTLEVSKDIISGVVIAQSDYPYSRYTKRQTDDIPIYGVTKKNSAWIYPQHVKRTNIPVMIENKVQINKEWATAGDYLLVVTGSGKTVSQSCARAYRVVEQIEVADKLYRDDVGEKLEDNLVELHDMGYAIHFNY
jgi:phosphoribosylamine--glycine ligase